MWNVMLGDYSPKLVKLFRALVIIVNCIVGGVATVAKGIWTKSKGYDTLDTLLNIALVPALVVGIIALLALIILLIALVIIVIIELL